MSMDRDMVAEWARSYIREYPVPDLVIGDDRMRRWHVVPRNDVANVYIHLFLKSDDDRALHDHPSDNVSWILDGEYLERFPDDVAIVRRTGDRVVRLAETPHRIELISGPALSLFTTGPRRREWGFHCPQGWRHHRDFLGGYSSGVGDSLVGRGCE